MEVVDVDCGYKRGWPGPNEIHSFENGGHSNTEKAAARSTCTLTSHIRLNMHCTVLTQYKTYSLSQIWWKGEIRQAITRKLLPCSKSPVANKTAVVKTRKSAEPC